MTDLIRRDDALAKIHWLSDADWTVAERRAAGEIAAAIASLPAVTVGVNESTVHRAVLDWIKNDTGAAVKLTISPDQANALTARILAALEPAAPDPASIWRCCECGMSMPCMADPCKHPFIQKGAAE